jgi:hypothetical protein
LGFYPVLCSKWSVLIKFSTSKPFCSLFLCCCAFPLVFPLSFSFAQSSPISERFKGGTKPLKPKQKKAEKRRKIKPKKSPKTELLKSTPKS